MTQRQVNLRLDGELLAAVDRVRGDVPRNRWLVRAVESAVRGGARVPEGQTTVEEQIEGARPLEAERLRRFGG